MIGLGLGVSGAAIATVIAETVSALLCFVYIYKTYPEFLPRKGDWRLKRELIREMLSTGLAMGLMQSVFSLGTIILQRGINHLGTRIITAHTASQRINEMPQAELFGRGDDGADYLGGLRRVYGDCLCEFLPALFFKRLVKVPAHATSISKFCRLEYCQI